ncbi:hypothetical protein CW680_02120 [Candidatus Bathyarchaeota archaeon]|nr:MAG: hypothetical protein CW680_02120 [Candidatus Bathyarchaeota archaeon]
MSLSISELYLKFLAERLRLVRGLQQRLLSLFESGVISHSTMEEESKKLKSEATVLEGGLRSLLKIIRRNMEELEKTIRLMEMHLTKIEVDYAAGELGEERYLKERNILTSGIELLKERLEHMKRLAGEASLEAAPEERAETILREVPAERAFYFYTDYGKYTGTYARSLEEFAETLEKISVESIRFHLKRGDFQVWIRDLGDPELAETLDRIDEPNLNDRELREEVARRVRERVKDLKAGLASS